MVILLGEIQGFSFPAKKSVDGLPLECEGEDAPSCPDLFPTLQRLARDDDVHESSPFLDGFFDKAPGNDRQERAEGSTILRLGRTLPCARAKIGVASGCPYEGK